MNMRKIAIATKAIERIAKEDHTTVDEVRLQIKVAMLNGLVSEGPKVKAYWQSIPHEGEVPTPEEFIAYTADVVRKLGLCSIGCFANSAFGALSHPDGGQVTLRFSYVVQHLKNIDVNAVMFSTIFASVLLYHDARDKIKYRVYNPQVAT